MKPMGWRRKKQLLGTGLEETHPGVASGLSDALLVQVPARLSFQFRDAVRKGGSRSRKSALREERARRALLFSKAGRLLAIEILESILEGCFGCDDHASRFRHQLRVRIQRSDSETRKLRCLLVCEYLVTPRDLRDDELGSLGGCRPGPDRYHCNVVRLEILRHIERELIETGLGGTVGRIQGRKRLHNRKHSPPAPHLPRSREVPR